MSTKQCDPKPALSASEELALYSEGLITTGSGCEGQREAEPN